MYPRLQYLNQLISKKDNGRIKIITGLRRSGKLGYCVGNIGGTIEEQINGAFDHMERRLALVMVHVPRIVKSTENV